jgi:BlaI family penicillinase repressor
VGRSGQLTDAEWKLMGVLWSRGASSARDVLDALADEGWAYTTVKTMLARLVDKGFAQADKQHNTSIYTAVLSEDEARRSAVDSLLDRAFGGVSQHLLAFLAHERVLSPQDMAELQRMLAKESRTGDRKDAASESVT